MVHQGTQLVLVQMAGAPGTGKSALAAALGQQIGAVVLDKDVVKSALLDAGIGWETAGVAASEAMFALADSGLAQGVSVVLDSPAHFAVIPERGVAVATAQGAAYRFIECVCEDLGEVGRRLAGRSRRRSQWIGPDAQAPDGESSAEQLGPHRGRTYGPGGGWLVLDSRSPLERTLALALQYVDAGGTRPASTEG
ncbi:MAG TPA: AAA family ATPase [Candidatus Acidoferrales bacterium]|nr:AAA family ATPase [Candidatus Acidoferrales bacterium]